MSFDWFFSLSILEKTDGWRSGGGQAGSGPRAAFLFYRIYMIIRINPVK